MLYILNQMLIKHKKIFEFFQLFWKVFLFWKSSEYPKFVELCFGYSLAGLASRENLVAS